MLCSQIIPSLNSPIESKSLCFICGSLLAFMQDHRYCLLKSNLYALINNICLSLIFFTLNNRLQVELPHWNWYKYTLFCSWVIFHWHIYHNFLIYSSADVHLDYFHVIAIVKRIAINIGVHVFLSTLIPSGYMQRSEVSGSYDNFSPRFSRNLKTVLNTGCTSLCYQQQCIRVNFSSYPFKDFLLVEFLVMATLNSMRRPLIIILIFIYLIMNDVKHISWVY